MGTRKALIPLTALAVLGTACGTNVIGAKAPEDVLREEYYERAGLKFEGDINGNRLRMYGQLSRGHSDIFLEVFSEDGTVRVYGNDWGPGWSADPTIEWVAIPAEDEIRIYKNSNITILKDGERTHLGYYGGIGDPVLKEAQANYDRIMAVIHEIEEQEKQEYYEETLKPLQEWALDALGSESRPPRPEAEALPEQIHKRYLADAELVFNEVVDGELVRLYERTYLRHLEELIIIVDREDKTSIFYQDWQVTPDLDTVAITKDGVTRFYEKNTGSVFGVGESERFDYLDYLWKVYSRIGTYEERHPLPINPLQQEALETIRGQ